MSVFDFNFGGKSWTDLLELRMCNVYPEHPVFYADITQALFAYYAQGMSPAVLPCRIPFPNKNWDTALYL